MILSPYLRIFGNPNPKLISNTIHIASNKIPIQKTHFEYQEKHNLNLNILFPRDPFAESVVFWVRIIEDSLKSRVIVNNGGKFWSIWPRFIA